MATHILVVDGHRSVRETLQVILEDEGYRVTTAANGQQALDRIAGEHPDVVLADLQTPGMTGRELRDRLRELAHGIPVVFMTTRCAARAGAEGERAEGCLEKPFAADELLTTLARAALG